MIAYQGEHYFTRSDTYPSGAPALWLQDIDGNRVHECSVDNPQKLLVIRDPFVLPLIDAGFVPTGERVDGYYVCTPRNVVYPAVEFIHNVLDYDLIQHFADTMDCDPDMDIVDQGYAYGIIHSLADAKRAAGVVWDHAILFRPQFVHPDRRRVCVPDDSRISEALEMMRQIPEIAGLYLFNLGEAAYRATHFNPDDPRCNFSYRYHPQPDNQTYDRLDAQIKENLEALWKI